MEKSSISINLFLIFLCITAFFYGIIGNGYILLALSFIPAVLKLISAISKNKSLPMSWISFIVFALISSTFSYLPSKTNNFIFMMVMLVLVKILLENEFGWQTFFIRLIFCFAIINVIATFMSILAPNLILSYAKSVFHGETLQVYLQLFERGAYAGINGQTAQNGFFISIFIAITVAGILTYPKKILNYIFLALSIIALFLTQKRSFLLGNILATLMLFWRNTLLDRRKSKRILTLIIMIIIVYFIISYNPATKGIIDKMSALENAGDITNGRSASWEDTLEIWKKNPIFGVGANSLVYTYDLSTHNVYLQVLAEMGVFGFIGYVALLLSSIKTSFRAYDLMSNTDVIDAKDKMICGTSIYMQVLFIVYSFFGNPLYGISFILPYTLFLAIAGSYLNYLRGKQNENRNINISQHA